MAGTLTITEPGTYSGSYSAVMVNTDGPVTLSGMTGSPVDAPFITGIAGVNLTVKSCTIAGAQPKGQAAPPAIQLQNAAAVSLFGNSISNVGGYAIYLLGGSPKIAITGNAISNINGSPAGVEPHAIIINGCTPASCQISYNAITNAVGASNCNDVINIYQSSGTAAYPIVISGNLLNGLWSSSPASVANSGCGICTDGGISPETGFVSIYGNTILNCGNAAIGVAAGHDIEVLGNVCASTGCLPGTTTPVAAANIGIYSADYMTGGTPANYYNIQILNNAIGWVNAKGVRNDIWESSLTGVSVSGTEALVGPITDALISNLAAAWLAGMQAAGRSVGA